MSRPTGVPARPTWYVGRAGVSSALDRRTWLTTVVAGAGAGKTIAIGDWAATRPVAWIALHAEDAELPVFINRLREAVVASNGFTAPVVETMRAASAGPGDHEYADSLAALLAAAAAEAGPVQATAIVLDGFDRIPAASATVRFVESLTRHAPGGLRLVISSRQAMPFAIERLRQTGHLTEITNSDLLFDADETYQLLTVALGNAAEADEIAGDLHTLTAGWPGQVGLAAAWLAQQPAVVRRSRLAGFVGSDGQLTEAVLSNAEPDVHAVVRVAAYLPRVNARLIAETGHAPDQAAAAQLLADCAPMLMPESGRPGSFRAAAAAKSAVLAIDPLPDRERRTLLGVAVRWFAGAGHLDSAIACAIELADPEVATVLLEEHGSALIANGRTADVLTAVAVVPLADRSPGVRLVEGEARHGRGDVSGALACISSVVPAEGTLTAAVARRIGKVRQLAGDIAGAADVYERAAHTGDEPIDEAILAGQLATVHWLRGNMDSARPAAKTAIAMAEACGDASALAGAYAAAAMVAEKDADFETNEEFLRRAATAAEQCGDLMQLTRVRVNRSQRLVQHGAYAEALSELESALRLTELGGTAGWFGAVIRTNRAWAFRGLGRHDEAMAEATAAIDFWQSANSDLVAYAQIARSSVFLDRGDIEQGEADLNAALAIGERSGDHQALNGLAQHARLRYASDPASAWVLAQRSLDENIGHWRHWAHLTMGWMALCDGDPAAARGYLAAAGDSMMRFRDAFALAEATELRALAAEDSVRCSELLVDAGRQWARLGNPVYVNRVSVALAHRTGRGIPSAEARLLALGVRPTAALPAGPLRAAGAFRVPLADLGPFLTAADRALALIDTGPGALGDTSRDAAVRQVLVDVLALVPDQGNRTRREQDRYVSVLRGLATLSDRLNDIDAALAWHLRLLEENPFDEVSHLGVVSTLASAGRHGEARRRYRLYTERMRQNNREPAPYPA